MPLRQIGAAGRRRPSGALACSELIAHSAHARKPEVSMSPMTQTDNGTPTSWRWQPEGSIAMPSASRAWISSAGSLTRALQALGHFRVHRVRQSFQSPTAIEQQLLQLPSRRWALIREVLLMVNDQPVAFARSVIPLPSLTGRNRILGHMACRPLGAELFRAPGAQRQVVLEAVIPPADLPCGLSQVPCYGRQSLFLKRGKPLLVAEIFLPALTASRPV